MFCFYISTTKIRIIFLYSKLKTYFVPFKMTGVSYKKGLSQKFFLSTNYTNLYEFYILKNQQDEKMKSLYLVLIRVIRGLLRQPRTHSKANRHS